MSAPAHPAVEFRAVTKRYGAVTAVDGVTFTIEKGAMVTLLGPSGCGKTTTLRLIAGLEMASTGTIMIDGIDVTRRPPTERDVSMVFQSYALFPHMTVERNVAYGLLASGEPRDKAITAAREALALVGLAGLEERLPSELSGGQQQRVAVARAVVLHPAVLLFDEPLSNLDAKLRRRVRDDIRELQQRLGLTAVYVTHDQSEALAVSDRIIVMDQARIAQQGSPVELYRLPASRFIAGFIGEANVVEGRLIRRDAQNGVVGLGGIELLLPHRGLADGIVQLAIRPEAIHIDATAPASPVLAGHIARSLFLGDHMEYTVDTGAGTLFVIDHHVDRPLAVGTDVRVSFRLSGLAVLPPPAT
jgi:iron(III) transport system ATP-binding protein